VLLLLLYCFFSSPTRRPPTSPLFPYTTLFRSLEAQLHAIRGRRAEALAAVERALASRAQVSGTETILRFEALEAVAGIDDEQKRSEEHSLNSSHVEISYAVFCLKKKKKKKK